MAELGGIDTSSYPKPVVTNPLDTVSKVIDLQRGQQALQSGALNIEKQKLDLVNQRFGEVAKTMTGLINDPNLNEDKIRKVYQDQVKLGYMPAEMAAKAISNLPPTQGLKPAEASKVLNGHIKQDLTHAMSVVEALNFHGGQPSTVDTGNAIQPVAVSTDPSKGIRSTGLPIQKQIPTGTGGFDENGQPSFAPPNPNAVAAPPPAQGANVPLPISRPAAAQAAPPAPQAGLPVQPPAPTFAQRFAPAAPPLFEKGAQALTEDQGAAMARATALKPAEQALKLLPGLRSGPGTEPFNKAVAFLKANNIISTDTENDPTAIYQEVNKKLAQYVSGSPVGQRSDAAQSLAEAASPSPKTQINPALVKLTRDAIALDRVQIARPNAFSDEAGNTRKDLQNYGQHRATFPQSIDERAFGLGDLPQDERQKLVKGMLDKYKKNPNDPEAKKFLRSYDIAKKQGFLGNSAEE